MSFPKNSFGSAGPFIIFPAEAPGSIQVTSCREAAYACSDRRKYHSAGIYQQLCKANFHLENVLTLFKTCSPGDFAPFACARPDGGCSRLLPGACHAGGAPFSSLSQPRCSCSPQTGLSFMATAPKMTYAFGHSAHKILTERAALSHMGTTCQAPILLGAPPFAEVPSFPAQEGAVGLRQPLPKRCPHGLSAG